MNSAPPIQMYGKSDWRTIGSSTSGFRSRA